MGWSDGTLFVFRRTAQRRRDHTKIGGIAMFETWGWRYCGGSFDGGGIVGKERLDDDPDSLYEGVPAPNFYITAITGACFDQLYHHHTKAQPALASFYPASLKT